MYFIENYKDNIRFNSQYNELHTFLKTIADTDYNEHFHWGRLCWMMAHPYLDDKMLSKNALFRSKNGELVGAVLYDTTFDDRWYILHSISDKNLLEQMIEYAIKGEGGSDKTIKANLNDTELCKSLENAGFKKRHSDIVLAMDLSHDFSFKLPQGFYLNAPDSEIDSWQWQVVIHRGFDHDGIPQEQSEEMAKAQKHLEIPTYIRTFAIQEGEYAAHCGVFYDDGNTAYIEPVVTVPEHRGKGLGKAVVYEALRRAKKQGAKRAIVLSNQEFYIRLGMTKSSEVITWSKK